MRYKVLHNDTTMHKQYAVTAVKAEMFNAIKFPFRSFAKKIDLICLNGRSLDTGSNANCMQINSFSTMGMVERSCVLMKRHRGACSQGQERPYSNLNGTVQINRLQKLSRSFHKSCPSSHQHSSTHAGHRNCWNCGRDTSPITELFFCDCGVVQKPASELSYFDLMQFEPSFDIDTKKLGEAFRETQKRLHPDKFSTKSKEELDLAQQQSSLLNKAYTTLQKPLGRALYLLKLKGVQIDENDSFLDPDFLMEVMDVNEQISKAKTVTEVEELERENNKKIESCVKEISELFKKDVLDNVKNTVIKLRYFTTIQERINELKRNNMN